METDGSGPKESSFSNGVEGLAGPESSKKSPRSRKPCTLGTNEADPVGLMLEIDVPEMEILGEPVADIETDTEARGDRL